METDDSKLLASVLKSELQQLQALSTMSQTQTQQHQELIKLVSNTQIPDEWKQLLLATNEHLEQGTKTENLLGKMIEGMQSIQTHLTTLTESMNQLVQSSGQQAKQMQSLTETFEDNTARLNAVIVTVASKSGDDSLGTIYQNLIDKKE